MPEINIKPATAYANKLHIQVKTATNRADYKVRQVIQDSEATRDPMRKGQLSEKT